MNTEILKVLKDLRSDLFYQIESKFGSEKASKYPSIVDADSLINKLTICGVVSSAPFNADHLWKKATEFNYALEKNGYLGCLEDLEKTGIIELKNIDINH